MSGDAKTGTFFVAFPTGEKFPVRFYQTSDSYRVELPAGEYEDPFLGGLKKKLRREFDGVKIEQH